MELAERIWLLKCGGKVIGPYSSQEVEELIRKRELLALDECTNPQGRWRYLRDENNFGRIFTILKNKDEFFPEGSLNTDGETMTESRVPFELHGFGSKSKLTEGIDKQISRAHLVKATAPTIKPDTAPSQTDFKVYASNSDPTVQKQRLKIASSARNNWIAVILTAGAIVTALIQFKVYQADRPRSYDQLVAEGLSAQRRGDFDRARATLSEAYKIRPSDETTALDIIPIWVDSDDFVNAERALEELVLSVNPIIKKRALNLRGLASLKQRRTEEARSFLEASLKVDPDFPPALHNLAAVQIYDSKYDEALKILRKLESINKDDPSSALLFGEAALSYAKNFGDTEIAKKALEDARRIIDRQIALGYNYRALLRTMRARVRLAMPDSDRSEIERTIVDVLDEDPYLESEYVRDLNFYRERAKWSGLDRWINEIVEQLPPSPRLKALQGLALYNGRDKKEGKAVIVDLNEQAQEDPILLALKGYVMEGLPNESEVQVDLAIRFDKGEKLPYILKARSLQRRGRAVDAVQAWKELLRIDRNYPSAVVGVAIAEKNSGQVHASRRIVEDNFLQLGNYGPLVKLREELEVLP